MVSFNRAYSYYRGGNINSSVAASDFTKRGSRDWVYWTKHSVSYDLTENLATQKALDVVRRIDKNSIVIGADTVVVLHNKILDKLQKNYI